jgi:formate hydrogenlyase subunit 3/multisubunit Na+/H+ antiporter MnhD subunit
MSFDVLLVLIGWLAALAIFFGFIILLRYLHHRETMALISHGINPERLHRQRRSRGMLRAGLIITMVGLALTIGLYPVGFFLPPIFTTPFHLGPWLLPGLIPLGVGIALIGSYYLEQNAQISDEDAQDNIIPIQEHQDKKHKEKY